MNNKSKLYKAFLKFYHDFKSKNFFNLFKNNEGFIKDFLDACSMCKLFFNKIIF